MGFLWSNLSQHRLPRRAVFGALPPHQSNNVTKSKDKTASLKVLRNISDCKQHLGMVKNILMPKREAS